MRRHFSIWKTTILGGVIFLLPFAIVVFLIGQLRRSSTGPWPEWSPGGISLATAGADDGSLAVALSRGHAARYE
jgi:hypothetical protein